MWFAEPGTSKIGRIAADGKITEYPTLTTDSQPSGITAGPDGALWFTELKANNVGRITTAGGITEYPITPPGSTYSAYSPYAITAGSDGALWFTAGQGPLILRMTTAGSVSARGPLGPTNLAEYFPNGIARLSAGAPGSDNFYITVETQDNMGNSNGYVAELSGDSYATVRQNLGQPGGITAGPDHASNGFAAPASSDTGSDG